MKYLPLSLLKFWALLLLLGLSGCTNSPNDDQTETIKSESSKKENAKPFVPEVYYISPEGDDSNDGRSQSKPWKSFSYAFNHSDFEAGDTLFLMPGDYSIAKGTGILRSVDYHGKALPYSAGIPSGRGRDFPTRLSALKPGTVKLTGEGNTQPLFLGRKREKARFIEIDGLKVEGGSALYNTQYVAIKNSGIYGGLYVGTGDHHQGNTHNLIEDVWVWAANRRAIAMNYRAHYNVWRRVVVRGEGCDKAGCESAPKADPSIGFTVYDSHDVSVQNMMVVDRLLRADKPYGDFATAQHTTRERVKASNQSGKPIDGSHYYLGRNEWLGSMSVNSQDFSLHFEADNVTEGEEPVWTIKHFVSLGNTLGGINIGNKPYNYDDADRPPSIIENASIFLSQAKPNVSAIRVSPEQDSVIIRNSLTIGATRTGYNARGSEVSNSASFDPKATEKPFDVSDCDGECKVLPASPIRNGFIQYPVDVENGSNINNWLAQNNVGARVVQRYGRSGSFFGDEGYNELTDESLWPWTNEARIVAEMCFDAKVERGFCQGEKPSLSQYIWEFFGSRKVF
ncbi:hypothetical protein [Aliikangiella sp. G2MR2-5]|uniref:hypothetical protein n=1 Tax=Aliikangiella sp. G2MR2-5 TaxID=2788943 RepID=UPI0018AC2A06|nr:hypothetical protein [Aliikangiella sp. G2MR2-5]